VQATQQFQSDEFAPKRVLETCTVGLFHHLHIAPPITAELPAKVQPENDPDAPIM